MLLVGSANTHKVAEISRILADLSVPVRSIEILAPGPDVEETGVTFSENACLKAVEFARRARRLPAGERPRWVMADDSGLCVDALDGRPGVWSARYAGENCSYADNNRKLLGELDGVPDEERGASFVCHIALAHVPEEDGADPEIGFEVEGRVTGRIATSPRGEAGFGYDPLFVDPLTGETFAELSPEEKNRRSHRGDALRQFRERLEALIRAAS